MWRGLGKSSAPERLGFTADYLREFGSGGVRLGVHSFSRRTTATGRFAAAQPQQTIHVNMTHNISRLPITLARHSL